MSSPDPLRFAPAPASSPAKITFVTGSNNAAPMRAAPGVTRNYSVKVVGSGASCNVAIGDANVALPSANEPLLEATDGWVDLTLTASSTHIRLLGGATGGVLYVWDWGN